MQQDWLRDFFQREIFPVLTPIALDPAHPFPFVASGSLNLAALLETNDPEEPVRLAVVQVPRVLPRVLRVPGAGPRTLRVPRRPDQLAAAGALRRRADPRPHRVPA